MKIRVSINVTDLSHLYFVLSAAAAAAAATDAAAGAAAIAVAIDFTLTVAYIVGSLVVGWGMASHGRWLHWWGASLPASMWAIFTSIPRSLLLCLLDRQDVSL